jgi:hypothetical protein
MVFLLFQSTQKKKKKKNKNSSLFIKREKHLNKERIFFCDF